MSRPGRRRTRPEPLGALVPSLLDDLGFEATRTLAQIALRWEDVVGERAAQSTRAAALRGSVLEVEADSSVWAQTLRLHAPEILERLRARFGVEAPRELWIRIAGPVRSG